MRLRLTALEVSGADHSDLNRTAATFAKAIGELGNLGMFQELSQRDLDIAVSQFNGQGSVREQTLFVPPARK